MNQFTPVCSHPGCAANYCNAWDRLELVSGQAVRAPMEHYYRSMARAESLASLYDDDGEAGWDANGSPVEAA